MSRARQWLSLCAGGLILFSAAITLYNNPPALPPIQEISWTMLLFLALTGQAAMVFHGLVFRQSLLPFGVKLHFREWFGMLHVALLWNYILPFSGHGFRGHYLKKAYQLSYTRYAASLLLMYPAHIAIFSFWGLVALVVAYFRYGYINVLLCGLFAVLALSPILVVLFAKIFEPFGAHDKVKQFLREGRNFLRDPGFAFGFFVYATLMYLFASIFTGLTYASLKYTIPEIASCLIP
ncbi:MAG: hypothetical protein QGI45_14805, partial [Myxococcota bacterium]|nr:hypothetical protein [Myxococcota bacterium]